MSLSDADYLLWLRTNRPRTVLAELDAYSEGAAVTRYLSTAGYVTGPAETPANTIHDARIIGTPTIRVAMDEPLGVGELTLDNADGALDAWLDDAFDGRGIRLYIGDPSWPRADFRPLLTGIIDHLAADHDTIQAVIRDRKELLNKPLQENLYTSGPAEGQPKPLALGRIRNAEPVLTNSTLPPVYQISDGPIQAVNALRINGVEATPTTDYTVALSTGLITLANAPEGRVTVDVDGERLGGTSPYYRTSDLVGWLAARAGLEPADIDSASMAALNALLYEFGGITSNAWDLHGLYIRERINAVEAINTVLGSFGCSWYFDREGMLKVWRLDEPTDDPVLSLGLGDIADGGLVPVAWEAPVKRIRLGGAVNWTIQDGDGLAPSLEPYYRDYWGQEYLDALGQDGNSVAQHLGALDPEIERTTIHIGVGVEASRRASLRRFQRRRYLVTIQSPTLPVELGAEIRITYPRFGFDAGRSAIVVGIEESFSDGITRLEVWR